MKTTVNMRIKKARKEKHYSQKQLGEILNIKCSTYSQKERNGSFSVDMALKIAEILQADPYYIIFGETEDKLFDNSEISPEVSTANEPKTFIELIRTREEELILTHNEKNLIRNLRLLKEKDRSDVIKYIESKRK
jgi:transcriptional regulator with XRE-family HTH domain